MKKFLILFLVTLFTMTFLISTAGAANLDLKRLLLYWACDDAKGETLVDASGRGFDGTLKGKASWVAGKVGGAVRLEQGYGEVIGNIIESTAKTGEITLACWFMMNSHSQYDGIISIEAAGGECCEYRILVNPASNPYWNAGHHVDKNIGNFAFDLKTWYHYALVADGKTSKIFVDGKFVGEAEENFKLPEFADITFYIGTGESPGTHPVEDAIIDEVSVWDKALTEEEFEFIMQGPKVFMSVDSKSKLATTWASLKK